MHRQISFLDDTFTGNQDLRVLRTGISGAENDKYGRLLARIETSVGIPIMGASDDIGEYFKLNGKLERIEKLPYKFTGILRLTGQFSPDSLPSFEILEVGGMNRVRGFFEGVIEGDNGYILSLELQRIIPHMPDFSMPYWPHKSVPVKLKDRIKAAAFYDQGFAHFIDVGEPIDHLNFIQSVGVGLRIKLTKFLKANMDLGIPLGKDRSPDQAGVRFNFTLNSDLI